MMFTEIPPRMTEWLLFWKAPRIPMRFFSCGVSRDKVAAVKIVDDVDDVLLSSQEGIIIRLHANEIPMLLFPCIQSDKI